MILDVRVVSPSGLLRAFDVTINASFDVERADRLSAAVEVGLAPISKLFSSIRSLDPVTGETVLAHAGLEVGLAEATDDPGTVGTHRSFVDRIPDANGETKLLRRVIRPTPTLKSQERVAATWSITSIFQ